MRCTSYFTLSLNHNIIGIQNQTREKERLSYEFISTNKLIRRMRPVKVFHQSHRGESVDVLGQGPKEFSVCVGWHQVWCDDNLIIRAQWLENILDGARQDAEGFGINWRN